MKQLQNKIHRKIKFPVKDEFLVKDDRVCTRVRVVSGSFLFDEAVSPGIKREFFLDWQKMSLVSIVAKKKTCFLTGKRYDSINNIKKKSRKIL